MRTNESAPNLWDKTKEKSKTITAAALIALGAVSLSACATSEAQPVPSATASADPTEASQPPVTETSDPTASPSPSETSNANTEFIGDSNMVYEATPLVTQENFQERLDALQISTEATPEEQAEQITNIMGEWAMAGATPEAPEILFSNENNQTKIVAHELAAMNTNLYATALFGPEWTSLPDSYQAFIYEGEERNAANLATFMVSYGDAANPHPYPEDNPQAFYEAITFNELLRWEDQENSDYEGAPDLAPVARAQNAFGSNEVSVITFSTTERNNSDMNNGERPELSSDNYTHAVLTPSDDGETLTVRYMEHSTQLNNMGMPLFVGDYY